MVVEKDDRIDLPFDQNVLPVPRIPSPVQEYDGFRVWKLLLKQAYPPQRPVVWPAMMPYAISGIERAAEI